MPPLKSPKQEKFCHKYLACGIAARAAVEAGYSVHSIRQIANQILTYPRVQTRLAELQKKLEDASVMSLLERKQRLSEGGRADLADFVSPDGETIYFDKDRPNHRAVIEYSISTTYTKMGEPVVTKSIKFHNPIDAIRELNKMEKIYDDSAKVNVAIDQRQVVFNVINPGTKTLLEQLKNGNREPSLQPDGNLPQEPEKLSESTAPPVVE